MRRHLGKRITCWVVLTLGVFTSAVRAGPIPEWLPQYDLEIHLNVERRLVTVQQTVTWTNRHQRPAHELVFNVFPRYKIPKEDLVLLAKTLELLRFHPSDGIDPDGRRLRIQEIAVGDVRLPFRYSEDNQTALIVGLPRPVQQGESVTVSISFQLELPQKQGRWGHWKGVTYLANWYPTVAYYDDCGWHPTPFVGWHQPFFNEAGVYSVRLTLPNDQRIASTGRLENYEDAGSGYKTAYIHACCAREFAIVCSNRFKVWSAQAKAETSEYCGESGIKVRVLAFPEDEHHAKKALEIACESIETYNRWFGVYPYDEFEVVESHFPWNGNECSGLIMIDQRVFSMPKLGEFYIDHLVSHETMHQWWYNVVGTNGYAETWMDEAVVSFFTTRRMQAKYGKDLTMLRLPKGFQWLPPIRYKDYRHQGLYGTLARGELTRTVQPMGDFGNLVTLFSMTYDRGSKIVGMIEEQLGETAFLDFMRIVYAKYQFRILFVRDFQHELEEYTGRSWEKFFDEWLYGVGMGDWAIEDVEMTPDRRFGTTAYKAVVTLRQQAEFTEPTVLGVRFEADGPYDVRVPIIPTAGTISCQEPPARIETMSDGTVRAEIILPRKPDQISVDPDQVILDSNPANNHWRREVDVRITPLLTNLDETDLTMPYDRWAIAAGPWAGVNGQWFGRRGYTGLRAALYRLKTFQGGVYTAYQFDDENIIVGSDALLQHWPLPQTQVGVQFDHSLTPDWAETRRDRGKLFGRYIIHYTPSLYLDPIEFVEVYGRIENEFWRGHDFSKPGVERYDDLTAVGVRYHRDYLTPYWDPEAGYRLDVGFEHGFPELGGDESYNRAEAEFSYVMGMPDWLFGDNCSPGEACLSESRIAARVYGGMSLPDNGEAFQLGGSTRLRGLARDTLQGHALWLASVEWRVPIWRDIDLDALDHIFRWRHLYGAVFYDVGDIYLNGDSLDGIQHAVGAGVRCDLTAFSFIERFSVRADVAKVVNSDEPMQFWFGFLQAY